LIEGIGLKANILFGPYSQGIDEWKTIPQANFNILLSSWVGLDIVKHLQEQYEQAYYHFPYFPIGGNETTKFLKELINFAEKQEADIDKEKALQFIKQEETAFYEEIDNLAIFLLEFRYGLPSFVHILLDAGYVIGISKFLLNEVGIVPKELFITDDTPQEYREEILKIADGISDKRKVSVSFQADGGLAQKAICDANYEGRGLVIGCGWDKLLAKDKGYDFVSAGFSSPYRLVLNTPYIGYNGGLRLIEDIYNAALASYR
jgi:nitrogenase molybdenum-iron protein beta chain